MVESMVPPPYKLACRASALLVCHDPIEKLASRPGAAPGKLSFGDSAAQAGARLIGSEFSERSEVRIESACQKELVRLLLNHNRGN